MSIKVKLKGDFTKTRKYFITISEKVKNIDLNKYGEKGVEALSSATPVDTGKTAASWVYDIIENKDGTRRLSFTNTNYNNGVQIAIVLQYGHGTRYGGWVEGRDYINPAIQPIFDEITSEIEREVKGR
jgi:hypothetical protein